MNIGELSRLTGLPVKTIRYYSDIGLVPETDRTGSGYRRYDQRSLIRLEFVRTLRDLGLDLATVRRILDRDADLATVAAAHADAIAAQIRVLKVRRAALRALARREPTPQDVDRMNRIAQASAAERDRILADFLDSIFDGVPADGRHLETTLRATTADLPDEPTDAQLDAWIELAELVRDPDFRDRLRAMGHRSASQDPPIPPQDWPRLADLVTERVQRAINAGVTPASAEAAPILNDLVAAYATSAGQCDDSAFRRALLDQLTSGYDPRAERYWQLLAIINGWAPVPSRMHLWRWFMEALRAPT